MCNLAKSEAEQAKTSDAHAGRPIRPGAHTSPVPPAAGLKNEGRRSSVKEQFLSVLERGIGSAASFVQLRELRGQMQEHVLASLSSDDSPENVVRLYEMLNHLHDGLVRRTIALSEERLAENGRIAPPVPYAFVLFGSGGRNERTLWSDQDNGIIYGTAEGNADPSVRKAAGLYFSELGKAVSEGLQAVGYPPCDGKVVCANPDWTQPADEWRQTLNRWFDDPVFENVRYLLIAADMRFLYGDADLARQWKAHYMRKTNETPSILKRMLKNTLHHKVTLNVFGQLIRERYGQYSGGVEIKYGAYVPMVNGIRHLTLLIGVQASSTLERIDALETAGLIPSDQLQHWKEAFILLLKMRLLTDHREEDGLLASNGIIPRERLTKRTIGELKRCLRAGRRLQRSVANIVEHFHSGDRL